MERTSLVDLLAREGFVAAEEEAAELLAAAAGDEARLRALVERRLTGEPLAWITGTVEFCGLTLQVHPDVYVPRWHTELVAEEAARRLPERGVAIDVCTGCGAIAATLMARRPHARVLAADLDPKAVANARANGVDARVGDLFEPWVGGAGEPRGGETRGSGGGEARGGREPRGDETRAAEGGEARGDETRGGEGGEARGSGGSEARAGAGREARGGGGEGRGDETRGAEGGEARGGGVLADVVVAVVPYVPTRALPFLQRDTFRFETALAYDGGEDGLDILRRVIREAPLRPGGTLVLEIGGAQAGQLDADLRAGYEDVAELVDEYGDVRGVSASKSDRTASK
ncbi:MAG TPA: hypothetical protein VNS09_07785 [Solirubrobacter sp.]|nr:hypothetical protein [Solirubrobacter sp.]